MSLKQKTLSGTFWTFTEQVGVKGLNLLIQIILARLLLPKDFGLIAMVTVFIGIGNALVDSGMTQSLIRIKEPSQKDFSSVFFLNIGISLFVYILVYMVAPFVADFYSQPQLTTLLRCYALVIPVKSLMAVQSAILTIKMDFRSQMLIQVPSLVIAGIIAIYLANQNYGVWVLVYMQLITAVLVTTQYWFYSSWRPILIFDKERLKYHFDFGYKLTLTTFINSVFNDIYNILIGRYFNVAILGIYNRASTFQKFLPILAGRVINRVTYPLFSKLTDDIDRLRDAFKKINKVVYYLYLPVMLFLILNAEAIIVLLLTDKWIDVVPIFRVLCIGGLIQPIQYYSTNIIQSFGESGLILKINLISRIFTVLGILVVIQYGVYALVVFEGVNLVITSVLFMFFSGRFIEYPILIQFKDILEEVLVAFSTSILCYILLSLLSLSNFSRLILYVLIFVPLFVIISHIFKVETYQYILKESKTFYKKIKSR
jgi:teichuronic acid exporter